jgi:hypothetical protein
MSKVVSMYNNKRRWEYCFPSAFWLIYADKPKQSFTEYYLLQQVLQVLLVLANLL